jgi:hypothetical protein
MRHFQIEAGPTPPYPDIQVIDGTGPNPHQRLTWAHLRIGDIPILDNVEITMFFEIKGFHELNHFFKIFSLIEKLSISIPSEFRGFVF